MNPKTLHTMQLLFSAIVLICLAVANNFPQYAPLCNDIAGFLATCVAALAGHAMPTGPQAEALREVAAASPSQLPSLVPALPTYVHVVTAPTPPASVAAVIPVVPGTPTP
jgi:hypothetical protein